MVADDWMLLMGPLGALLVVPVAVAALAVRRRPRWALSVGAVLVVAVAASWLAYWATWGKAFEFADALQTVPASLEARQAQLAVVTAVATAALALMVAASVAATRRR